MSEEYSEEYKRGYEVGVQHGERYAQRHLSGITQMIAYAVDAVPQEYQTAIRDTMNEVLLQLQNPTHLHIYGDRYRQLSQEAALTIEKAVKMHRGNPDHEIARLPVEKEP